MADIGHPPGYWIKIGTYALCSMHHQKEKKKEKERTKMNGCSWGNVGPGIKQWIIQAHQGRWIVDFIVTCKCHPNSMSPLRRCSCYDYLFKFKRIKVNDYENHLLNPLDQIKIGLSNHLSSLVGSINSLS
jgi:hypothetical protein